MLHTGLTPVLTHKHKTRLERLDIKMTSVGIKMTSFDVKMTTFNIKMTTFNIKMTTFNIKMTLDVNISLKIAKNDIRIA